MAWKGSGVRFPSAPLPRVALTSPSMSDVVALTDWLRDAELLGRVVGRERHHADALASAPRELVVDGGELSGRRVVDAVEVTGHEREEWRVELRIEIGTVESVELRPKLSRQVTRSPVQPGWDRRPRCDEPRAGLLHELGECGAILGHPPHASDGAGCGSTVVAVLVRQAFVDEHFVMVTSELVEYPALQLREGGFLEPEDHAVIGDAVAFQLASERCGGALGTRVLGRRAGNFARVLPGAHCYDERREHETHDGSVPLD